MRQHTLIFEGTYGTIFQEAKCFRKEDFSKKNAPLHLANKNKNYLHKMDFKTLCLMK